MDEEITQYSLAKEIQYNNKSEAQAIEDYTLFLESVKKSSLKDEDKEFIISSINEIIGDELNHQIVLQELYTMLSNVEPKKD